MKNTDIIRNKKIHKTVKNIIVIFLAVFIFLNILPYLIPVKDGEACMVNLPFAESEIIEIENVSIHYRLWIPQRDIKGKILMIHGLGGSTFSWLKSVDSLLAAGYLVVAADLPGFGYSDRTPGLDHSQKTRSNQLWILSDKIVDEINEDGENIDMNWNLMGHSMGGGTVAAMAMERPDNVSSLIFVAGAVFDNNHGNRNILFKYPPIQRWMKVVVHNYAIHPKRVGSFLESAYGREPSDSEVSGYLNPLQQSGTSNTVIDMIKTAKNEPIENLIDKDFPILGVWGEKDTWVPKSEGERLKTILPQMQLEIIGGAAHCPMETNPDEFNPIILKFLSEVD